METMYEWRPTRWKRLEPGPSKIEDAIVEIERAMVDLRGPARRTTKAQERRAMRAIGYLKTVSNYCVYKHYDRIQQLDEEEGRFDG